MSSTCLQHFQLRNGVESSSDEGQEAYADSENSPNNVDVSEADDSHTD